jgi:hypothetical protein
MGAQQDKSSENGHSSSDPNMNGGFSKHASKLDELEEFASGGRKTSLRDSKSDATFSPIDEDEKLGSAAATASGAAMKEAVERAEAKLRQVKEAKDRGRSQQSREERGKYNQEPSVVHEGEEKEAKEWRRREQEKEREREREREKDMATEIAGQQREGSTVVQGKESQKVADAKAKADRKAVQKAMAEARGRHDRAAMERAKAVDRDETAAAKEQQQRTDNDIESFFMSGTTRPTSAPKQRTQAMVHFMVFVNDLWFLSRFMMIN